MGVGGRPTGPGGGKPSCPLPACPESAHQAEATTEEMTLAGLALGVVFYL